MKKSILRVLCAVCALVLLVSTLASCGYDVAKDAEYVTKKGKLVVGITDFEPMDYKDANGKWIGFDADLARAFGEYLGVEVEFVEIDWDSKETELKNKTIDCVWNGMTLTDGVKAAMETSKPYMDNAQVIVTKKAKVPSSGTFTDEEIKALKFAVENGSAGDEVITAKGVTPTRVTAQADALLEVNAGTSDACVIDLLMALAMTGEGTSYPELTFANKLNSEQYGVGFRKGSNLAAKLDEFLGANAAKLAELGKTYNVAEAVIK